MLYALGLLPRQAPLAQRGHKRLWRAYRILAAKGVGVIVLSNEQNKCFADSVGLWLYDKLLGNSETDYARKQLAQARETVASEEATLSARGKRRFR